MSAEGLAEDRLNLYLRALIAQAKRLQKTEYGQKQANRLPRSIGLLTIAGLATPFTTPEQVGHRVHGVGATTVKMLKQAESRWKNREKGALKRGNEPPPPGQYASATTALLVGLLQWTEEQEHDQPGEEHTRWCPGCELHRRAQELYEGRFASMSPISTLNACPAWKQLGFLHHERDSVASQRYVLQRQRKKLCPTTGLVYALSDEGRRLADAAQQEEHMVDTIARRSGTDIRRIAAPTGEELALAAASTTAGKMRGVQPAALARFVKL